jgi:hypothetical protein
VQKKFVVDVIREIESPFSPEQATEEFATLLKSYNLHRVVCDKFGSEWVVEQCSKFGITAEQLAPPKSVLYLSLLPTVNSRRLDLVDEPRTINQACSLERLTRFGGRETIDHPPGQHDDNINSVAGLIWLLASKAGYAANLINSGLYDNGDNDDEIERARQERRRRLG